MTITWRVTVAMLSVALCMACIPPRVVPKATGKYSEARPHPTPERLQALMADAHDYVPDLINEITLSTVPRATLKGGHVRASCIVPRHYLDAPQGWIDLRADGKVKGNTLDQMETVLYVGPVPCGGVEVRCTVQTFRGTEARTLRLETGDCDG